MSKIKVIIMLALCVAMLFVAAGCGKGDGEIVAGNRDDSLYAGNGTEENVGDQTTAGGSYYNDKFYSDTEYNYEEKNIRLLDKSDIPAVYTVAEDGEQLNPPKAGDRIAEFVTNYGSFKVRLFEDQAPITVANFVSLAEQDYFDGMIFHRVIGDFMIQGGDPEGTGYGGDSVYGEDFENECGRNLFNFRGALSMANTGYDFTNSSQFFVVQCSDAGADAETLKAYGWPEWAAKKYEELGGTPHLDGGLSPQGYAHTVFGQVYEGMEIVDAIAAVKTDANNKPLKNVYIYDVILSICEG